MFPDSVELIGGYHARLCAECQNAWHVLVREHPARLTLSRIEAEIAILIARTTADGRDRLAELRNLQKDDRAARGELYALAEQWVSERGARGER
jgi:hypothetical protein